MSMYHAGSSCASSALYEEVTNLLNVCMLSQTVTISGVQKQEYILWKGFTSADGQTAPFGQYYTDSACTVPVYASSGLVFWTPIPATCGSDLYIAAKTIDHMGGLVARPHTAAYYQALPTAGVLATVYSTQADCLALTGNHIIATQFQAAAGCTQAAGSACVKALGGTYNIDTYSNCANIDTAVPSPSAFGAFAYGYVNRQYV